MTHRWQIERTDMPPPWLVRPPTTNPDGTPRQGDQKHPPFKRFTTHTEALDHVIRHAKESTE
jgi:hypothetical protein